MIREQIKADIVRIARSMWEVEEDAIDVTRAIDPNFGDYSTNIAMKLAKQLKQSPMEIAKKLTDSMKDLPYVEKLQAKEPGFVNIFVKDDVWQDELQNVLKTSEPKTILVEYAHPNTHKLFHIGHLRNITTGETIARLLEAVGHNVTRANYQGDVGLHIAKAIWGIINLKLDKPKSLDEKVELLAHAYKEGNVAYEEGGQKDEIDEINKKLYEKEPEAMKLWEETRAWSLEYFDRIYKRVGTKFDRLYFESEVADSGREEVMAALKKGIFEQSDGAVIFDGEKFGLHKRVFINGKGFPTYEGKDIGLAKLQFGEYSPDLIIHAVAPEQTDYFKVIFKAIEQVFGETAGRELHVPYGWVRLKEGKMSSRKGEVITGEWLLDEAKTKAREIFEASAVKKEVDIDKVCEQVAIAAVKYSFLKLGLAQDLVFDINEAVNLHGNSGPYLQYTYARCQSLLEKADPKVIASTAKQSLKEAEEISLLRALGHFQETVLDAAEAYSPNLLANFLYEVAQKYNTLYNNLQILNSSETEKERRLFLTRATAKVLKKGLYLLGIEAPNKM